MEPKTIQTGQDLQSRKSRGIKNRKQLVMEVKCNWCNKLIDEDKGFRSFKERKNVMKFLNFAEDFFEDEPEKIFCNHRCLDAWEQANRKNDIKQDSDEIQSND